MLAKVRQQRGQPYTRRTLGENLRALAVEFGPAELLASFLIRLALMYHLPRWLGHSAAGIMLAKVLADVTFYVPAVSVTSGARSACATSTTSRWLIQFTTCRWLR
ncbi:hypothetical protein [Hymenobacter glacialis]|uniref:Uncharacterized protein n=1 Tax=Hymenobacter glacialis TaxID=1908236 RepID=A0A1G1T435_9BACT|nr:hypothetical protein [Hymenobacter glacialis]OGX85632.1 hypothetical protein BEN48_02025 [Hymenobacter glacialis]